MKKYGDTERNAMKRRYMVLFFFIIVLCAGCTAARPMKKTDFCMDTYISVTVYRQKDEKWIDEVFSRCHAYEDLLSKTSPDSDISRLENARFSYVPIAQETREIIEIYQSLYEASEGKLDCTIGALTGLWNFHEPLPDDPVPSAEAIQEAAASVDANALILKDDTACLASETAKLDFGAVAKGYIAGKMRDFLVEQGVESAILDFGGNIVVIGSRPDGKPFRIGIQQPFGDANEAAASLSVSDQSVITAGVYQRYFRQGETLYHHILDPSTGYSAQTDLYSATILCDDPAAGDAYSTICILLGKEKALDLIRRTPGLEAIFITENNEIIYSDPAEKDKGE